jgi:hypothetical protein
VPWTGKRKAGNEGPLATLSPRRNFGEAGWRTGECQEDRKHPRTRALIWHSWEQYAPEAVNYMQKGCIYCAFVFRELQESFGLGS